MATIYKLDRDMQIRFRGSLLGAGYRKGGRTLDVHVDKHRHFLSEATDRYGMLCLLIGLLFFIGFLAYVWKFTVDDAFISFRYAKHLAEGYGLVWNIGEYSVEGYTNFLWVVIMAFIHLIKLDPALSAKIIGIFSLIGILYVCWKLTNEVFNDNKVLAFFGFCAGAVE